MPPSRLMRLGHLPGYIIYTARAVRAKKFYRERPA